MGLPLRTQAAPFRPVRGLHPPGEERGSVLTSVRRSGVGALATSAPKRSSRRKAHRWAGRGRPKLLPFRELPFSRHAVYIHLYHSALSITRVSLYQSLFTPLFIYVGVSFITLFSPSFSSFPSLPFSLSYFFCFSYLLKSHFPSAALSFCCDREKRCMTKVSLHSAAYHTTCIYA